MKRYTEYKDSGIEWIGVIPSEWSIVSTKRLFQNNKCIVGDNVDGYERLALTMNGVIKRSKEDAAGLQPEKFESYQILRKNELVFKLIDLENIKTSRVGLSPFTGIVSPAYITLSNTETDNRFYYYFYMFMYYNNVFNNLGGAGVRSTLNSKDLLNIPVPKVLYATRQLIADYLDQKSAAIDTLITDKQKLIDLLKEKRQAIISEAVTKGLDKDALMIDSGIEWIGEIPKGWDVKKLRYLGSCQNGLSKAGEYFGSGYPFVSYGDVYKNYELPQAVEGLVESTEVERESCSVIRGDVFFTRTSETIEEVALTSTCLSTVENATFAGFLIRFRPYTHYEISPEFSKYYFRSQIHRAYFVKEMNLVTRASLSQELLKNLPVVLPPIEEQQVIADYLEKKTTAIDTLITEITLQIEKLKEYRQSIISEVVTGKVAI